MPNYKVIDADRHDGAMLATAEAIRAKGKTESDIPWDMDTGFKQAIEAITGGADLNFEVVGGKTAPVDPTENTIWVDTEAEITGWVFSFTEPTEPVDGMVWFPTDKSSYMEFNAIKDNSLQVYPLKAMQYNGGAWIEKPVKSYINGEWEDWWTGQLFTNGNQWEKVTGGWTNDGYKYTHSQGYTKVPAVIGDTITCHPNQASTECVVVGTANLINFKDAGATIVKCRATEAVTAFLCVYSKKTYSDIDVLTRASIKANDVTSLNVSGWTSGYVFIHVHTGAENRRAIVSEIWME